MLSLPFKDKFYSAHPLVKRNLCAKFDVILSGVFIEISSLQENRADRQTSEKLIICLATAVRSVWCVTGQVCAPQLPKYKSDVYQVLCVVRAHTSQASMQPSVCAQPLSVCVSLHVHAGACFCVHMLLHCCQHQTFNWIFCYFGISQELEETEKGQYMQISRRFTKRFCRDCLLSDCDRSAL